MENSYIIEDSTYEEDDEFAEITKEIILEIYEDEVKFVEDFVKENEEKEISFIYDVLGNQEEGY